MTTLSIPVARAFTPLLPSMRMKIADGGRASGKSHFFADNAVDLTMSYPGLRLVCVREVQKSLKLSSKRTIEDKLDQHKVKHHYELTNEEIRTPGGGVIVFQGMQNHTADSIKSLEGFDVAWVEEADKLSQRSLDLLTPTMRRTPRTRLPQPEVWFSYNRRKPTDPVDVLARELPPELGRAIHVTWRDNPWFPKELEVEREWARRRDPDKFAHVWEGGYLLRGDALVFKDWRVEDFDVPNDAVLYWGADWGFSVDPSVLVGGFIVGRTLFVAYEAWKVGCEIDDLPALFDTANPDQPGQARSWTITADSARVDTISYMARHGYGAMRAARKGPGSVEDGVEFLKSYSIVVHPRCVHVADELASYSYKVDKLSEQVLPQLEDKKNHTIDSLRYALESVRHHVSGTAQAGAGQIDSQYDASLTKNLRPIVEPRAAVEDVGAMSFDGHEYDGGLT